MLRTALFALFICIGLPTQSLAQQFIAVDFSTARLWHLYGDGQADVYPVVLPKPGVQREMNLAQPVLGEFVQADYKPTWWPTANMRRRNPSLPSSIPFGQPGHPIGIYRLRIAWSNPSDPSFWNAVRIHGGAKHEDLYEAESAGCVRMLDQDINRVVKNARNAQQRGETNVQVSFGFFQK